MRVGSLFAGIGGFDLGLERAGFEVSWQVEIDPYCQRVLAQHWPTVPRYGDIRSIDWGAVEPVDLLCGGFPCQDLSCAGKRAGIDEPDQDSGANTSEPFAHFDPATSSWRTFQGCLLTQQWDEYSETWPSAGTMRNGKCYPQPALERRIFESESGLLPTPTAGMADRGDRGDLNTVVKGYASPSGHTKLIPTPRATDADKQNRYQTRWGNKYPTLTGVAKMWPTPNVPNGGRTINKEGVVRKDNTLYSKSGRKLQVGLEAAVKLWPTPKSSPSGPDFARMKRPESGGDDLATAVARMPTPTARDWKSGKGASLREGHSTPLTEVIGGQLNPTWVEWLMGYPLGWTDCADSATPSSPRLRSGSDGGS